MEQIFLDFTGCRTLGEIHRVLKTTFEFPDYYGENWDALWDCLSCYSNDPLLVEVRGLSTLPEGYEEEVEIMLTIFDRVHRETLHIVFSIIS